MPVTRYPNTSDQKKPEPGDRKESLRRRPAPFTCQALAHHDQQDGDGRQNDYQGQSNAKSASKLIDENTPQAPSEVSVGKVVLNKAAQTECKGQEAALNR